MKLTKIFLRNNKNIKIFQADKGGRVVITDLDLYKQKMIDHLNLNSEKHFYYYCNNIDFEYARNLCETKFNEIRPKLNEYFMKDERSNFKNLYYPLQFSES